MKSQKIYDNIIIGAGVSGPIIARSLVERGQSCLLLEAGKFFYSQTFPRKEIDANSQLYWSGGVELTKDAKLALLRPKAVGGGSIVNQALLDRFDSLALDDFKSDSRVSFFDTQKLAPYYDKIENKLTIQKIPEKYRNKNAAVFQKGFENLGYKCSPLTRAQSDCQYENGDDCIECLGGCVVNSKQSSMTTHIRQALKLGLKIHSEFEVDYIKPGDTIQVFGKNSRGEAQLYRSKKLILAAGAIGNSKLLLNSGFGDQLPAIGQYFYTHPQYMVLAQFKEPIQAFQGPLQSYKSDDPRFRSEGFKLENVFAPPVAISMLIKEQGQALLKTMQNISHLACIEVAIRDTQPGQISVNKKGRVFVEKKLNEEDLRRKDRGLKMIREIFESQNAQRIIPGQMGIGLHLMGGCRIGVNRKKAVVTPEFHLFDHPNIFCADSSIFPNAPGINPSLTIMAMSTMAAEAIQ